MRRISVVVGLAALCAGCAGTVTQPSGSGTVKITPLGSHDGEFCILDRALVLEDPDGTRILYMTPGSRSAVPMTRGSARSTRCC